VAQYNPTTANGSSSSRSFQREIHRVALAVFVGFTHTTNVFGCGQQQRGSQKLSVGV
jgi:hypothetical protein